MFDSACFVMAQIQSSLIKKKIGRPEYSLPPIPVRPITSHFCLTLLLPTSLKVDVIFVSPLIVSKAIDHGS